MNIVGQVESVWRYPVKSMRGEKMQEAFVGFCGVYGDRYYAFRDSAAPTGFPYLTAREQGKLLHYQPIFRNPECAAKPPNLREAEALAPGITPAYSSAAELSLEVETPGGERLSIDDPKLIEALREEIREGHELTLVRSDRALTDCRPVSLFSLQTARQLGEELGVEIDKKRFRANIYLDLKSARGFSEDGFAGSRLRIGDRAVIAVLERDPRCKMITLDPENAQPNPEIMKRIARFHEGKAGVYGAVLVEGMIRAGDDVTLLD